MRKPLVSIIIVNWNGKHFLHDCLSSLAAVTYKNREIIFVDNASTDGSAAYVKKNFPNSIILTNKSNLGFAQGHEVGFKRATGELVLLLSTDTTVEPNLLDELIAGIYSTAHVGAVMPKLVMYPQTNKIDSVGSFFTMSGVLYHYGREQDPLDPNYNKAMQVYSAKGACLLFKKEILKKTGLFDKDYFAYFEETDLCHRILLTGNDVLYWPKTTVYHKGGGASKQMVSAFIQFHSYKNRLCTYLKNLSVRNLFIVLPQLLLVYQAAFIMHLITGKVRIAIAIERSIWWNMVHISETLKKRTFIQSSIRAVSDDAFLPKVTRSFGVGYLAGLFFGLSNYRYKHA